jgi:hypothetical protein
VAQKFSILSGLLFLIGFILTMKLIFSINLALKKDNSSFFDSSLQTKRFY